MMGDIRDIEDKIDEKYLVRILKPEITQTIMHALTRDPQLATYIHHHQNQVYISLQQISDPEYREQLFGQLMALQMGHEIQAAKLPQPYRHLLLPGYQNMLGLAWAIFLGSLIGIIVGITAMAMMALIVAVSGFEDLTGIGLSLSAVSFIVFAVLGSFGSSIIIWKKMLRSSQP